MNENSCQLANSREVLFQPAWHISRLASNIFYCQNVSAANSFLWSDRLNWASHVLTQFGMWEIDFLCAIRSHFYFRFRSSHTLATKMSTLECRESCMNICLWYDSHLISRRIGSMGREKFLFCLNDGDVDWQHTKQINLCEVIRKFSLSGNHKHRLDGWSQMPIA